MKCIYMKAQVLAENVETTSKHKVESIYIYLNNFGLNVAFLKKHFYLSGILRLYIYIYIYIYCGRLAEINIIHVLF